MKKRKITVVTGTRADYGILKPLLFKIKNSENLNLQLIVTGIHLLKKYGLTIHEIKKDGLKIEKIVKMYFGKKKNQKYYGMALAEGIRNFTKLLFKIKPDILVVLGDRLEPLAATLAATSLRIPTAHIHGGDKTDSGHIDESIRHCITRFAHIHFTPTESCKKRLIQMGEEPWRIYNVGALNIDAILSCRPIKKEILFKKLGLDYKKKLILCIFNPVHLEAEKMGRQMREIIKALRKLKIQTLIIYPNNDAGSEEIISEIKKGVEKKYFKTFSSLPHEEYINVLKYSDILIGNSSSGLIEAPSLKVAVVNIGSRNVGREHAQNVIFVEAEKEEIIKAIKNVLYDKKFRKKIEKCKNPYDHGKMSEKIVKILSKIKVDKKLLKKRIIY